MTSLTQTLTTGADALALDLRLALRGLRRDWRYSAVAIVMLALALGLNVTVFTVMDAMLFRGLPHTTRSDRIVFFEPRTRANNFARMTFADFEAYRSQATSFETLAFTGGGGNIVFRDSTGRSIDTVMTRLTANSFACSASSPRWDATSRPLMSSRARRRSRSSVTTSGTAGSANARTSSARSSISTIRP